jgi:chorismate mutase
MRSIINNIDPISDFLTSQEKPLIIAGPCSAESEEQVLQTARALAKVPQVAAFRCGLWKPRTRPGEFEGRGEEGIGWLKKAKLETGLKMAVEVALPAHIEICLKNDIDILWIGSRTVVNPFSVNEIAEALKGVDIPVLVKNPVNPDLLLWIGALERLSQQGIQKLAAVHRGFSAYGSKPFRNLPLWEIPIELRRLIPGLPVLVDPSHISGNRAMLPHVAQTAMDLAFDGLMIESHIRPEKALTDRNQQVTPSDLQMLIAKLSLPSIGSGEVGKWGSGEVGKSISELRLRIDDLDSQILQLLGQRMETAAIIGRHKKDAGMDALQLERWKEVVEDRLAQGKGLGLSRNFLMKLLHAIHEEALQVQAARKSL